MVASDCLQLRQIFGVVDWKCSKSCCEVTTHRNHSLQGSNPHSCVGRPTMYFPLMLIRHNMTKQVMIIAQSRAEWNAATATKSRCHHLLPLLGAAFTRQGRRHQSVCDSNVPNKQELSKTDSQKDRAQTSQGVVQ